MAYKRVRPGQSLSLGTVKGTQVARLIRSGVFCGFDGLDVGLLATESHDTTFTYQITCDYALTKPQQAAVSMFIRGMVEMWRLTGGYNG